jgi:hypothetical protein
MRGEVDEGISNNKSFGFWVKICRFCIPRSRKGDFFKPSHFRFDFSLNQLGHFLAEPIMVGIRADNDDGRSERGIVFGPIDRVEKDRLPGIAKKRRP